MSKLLVSVLAVAFLVGTSGLVVAADAAKGEKKKKGANKENVFKKKDTNGDSKLSLEEFKGKAEGDKATKAENHFKKMDKDGDGFLTLAEFTGPAKKAPGEKKKKKNNNN